MSKQNNSQFPNVSARHAEHAAAHTPPTGWSQWEEESGLLVTRDEGTGTSAITVMPSRGVTFIASRLGKTGEPETKRGRKLDVLAEWATKLLVA